MRIRPARPADFPRIAELTLAAYRDDHQLPEGSPYARVLADVSSRAAAGHLLVAEDPATATVVGSVLYVRAGSPYAEMCGPDEAEFRTLAVDPAIQRRGVGQVLVRACLERAAAEGCTGVVICSRDLATAAHRLYARFGFVRIPERDWTPAPGVDLWALRLDLSVPPAGGREWTTGAKVKEDSR